MSTSFQMPDFNRFQFEQGPIRPPSEAYSLLLRVTRNCPWNRCRFCSVYKEHKFELRTAEEVIADIEKIKSISDGIKEVAKKMGDGGKLKDVAAAIYNQYYLDMSVRNVGLWLWAGGKNVFLQDANTLIMRTPDLLNVLNKLKEIFPEVNRITSYARSKTAAKKTVEELVDLRNAGLSRLHIGMESGSDVVLKYIDKGVTGAEHVEGGKRIKQSGISLSEYIMPGIGGRKMSADHVEGTAYVLNQIDPDFIRLRSTCLSPRQLMWSDVESKDFELQTDDEVALELHRLIEKLEVTSYVVSDHIMNLLPEIEGKFPEAKSTCLNVIDRYLALPVEERNNYKLGRRMGAYEKLDDLKNSERFNAVQQNLQSIENDPKRNLDEVIDGLKAGMVNF